GITNPKDFRNEVVKFSLRSRAQNSGRNPSWTSYEKIREVNEKRIISQVEDLLPVISFGWWSQPVDATLYLRGKRWSVAMDQGFRRGFTAAEKSELWDRWQRGE